jgi:hypothetical protein
VSSGTNRARQTGFTTLTEFNAARVAVNAGLTAPYGDELVHIPSNARAIVNHYPSTALATRRAYPGPGVDCTTLVANADLSSFLWCFVLANGTPKLIGNTVQGGFVNGALQHLDSALADSAAVVRTSGPCYVKARRNTLAFQPCCSDNVGRADNVLAATSVALADVTGSYVVGWFLEDTLADAVGLFQVTHSGLRPTTFA